MKKLAFQNLNKTLLAQPKIKKWLKILLFLHLVGMVIALYLVYLHYRPDGVTTFCDVNGVVNCTDVNKSEYSVVLGIPVALFGFLMHALLFLLCLGLYKDYGWHRWHEDLSEIEIAQFMFILISLGMIFNIYLVYVEFVILAVFCLFCVIHQVLVFIIWLIHLLILGEKRKRLV